MSIAYRSEIEALLKSSGIDGTHWALSILEIVDALITEVSEMKEAWAERDSDDFDRMVENDLNS